MADLRRMHLTISKGMKLSCTVEQAFEDAIVVSLKHKTKEYLGILLDSSERHFPPGLCFSADSGATKFDEEKTGSSSVDGSDQTQPREAKGVTLDCRYSYNNDPAKYNEQPLPTTSAISIRPARGKQVRNIRLRPRQTLCSKCKAAIHDTKAKSPNKITKPEGDGQEQETHPHNTRYRAAQTGKPTDASNTPAGPTLRSGLRNRRSDSTPKVLLQNIRPKRDVKPTAKKKDADAAQRHKLSDNSAKKINLEEQVSDSANVGMVRSDLSKRSETTNYGRREEDNSRVMVERSVSLDSSTALSQYNKQPVVRLEKSSMNTVNVRTESREEKQEKAPTISIVNIRSTPAIKISYGTGDRDVVKIPPRLPGAELKSPDGHSTADESPAPVSPPPPPTPPQKKTKKASRRTRDKQRYRIVNNVDAAAELSAPGIKLTGHHRKHKRKHKHRRASSEDENFNSEVGVPPPTKFPAIITKLSVVPFMNDMNGNEKKSDSDVLKDSSNETPTRQEEPVELITKSPHDSNETAFHIRREDSSSDYGFDSDPLSLRIDSNTHETQSEPKSPSSISNKETDFLDLSKTEASESSPSRSDVKSFEMWASPVKIEAPTFEIEGSPAGIEAPPFQSDDSQDGLIIGPLRVGSSPVQGENQTSCDSLMITPSHAERGIVNKKDSESEDVREKKVSVPYGVGVFEDLTPDEDEDDHEDYNVGQPLYQLPLTKKPRMMFGGWPGENLTSSSQLSGYLSKKSAAILSESSSSVYPNRPRIYQNGPNSYFSASPGSSSLYPNNPTVFPSSPVSRIQNSPTPIIQKSPVPIFNYNSSRYQSSPNRRFGSSPSRRQQSTGENVSSRSQSIIEANLRHLSQSSLSRYPAQETDQFQTARERHSISASGYRTPNENDLSSSSSASRFPTKFDSRSTIRYQSSAVEKKTGSRYAPQSENGSVSRLPSADDSSSGTKSYMAAESSSTLRFVSSSGDSGSVPRFAISNENNSPAAQYPGEEGSSALPRFSVHPSEGSLPGQYPSLGSKDSRYQPQCDTKYKLSTSIPPAPSISLQTSSRNTSSLGSGPVYQGEKERKSGVLPAPCYETVDTSALFMTHSHGHNLVSSGDNNSMPSFLSKSLSTTSHSQTPAPRVPSSDSLNLSNVFTDSPGQNVAVSYLRQDPKLMSGSSNSANQGTLFLSQGQSGSSITSHPSPSSLSQGHASVSDSEDDSDSAVPGFIPSASMLNANALPQDMSRMPMMKIQTQNLPSVTEDGREIRVGDVQWGKVQGFPWWPCRVLSIKLTHRDHREQELIVTRVCHVSWFGSSTVSDLHPSELRPFRDEFTKRHVKKKRGPYQIAVQQAMVATDLTVPTVDTRVLGQQPNSLMYDLVS